MLLQKLAKADGKDYNSLPDVEQARYLVLLKKGLRTNTFDSSKNTIVFSKERAKVYHGLMDYYAKLFRNDPSMAKLRDQYAIAENTVKDTARMSKMSAFFARTTWVFITERPGGKVIYTNNWPHDELVGNIPSPLLHL